MLWPNRCRGVSHTPFMAGNLLLFDEIRFYTAAIYPSFAHVRAYAIRPYRYSVEIKWLYPKQNIKSHLLIRMLWPNRCMGVSHTPFTAGSMLLFDIISYCLAANYTIFAAVRAYAIRPYSYSVKIKWIYPIQNIKTHLLIRMLWSNKCRDVSHTPSIAGNMLLFDEIRTQSAAKYILFAAMRAYAIRPYTFSIIITWLCTKQNIKSHSLIRMLWPNRCRGVSHTPFMAANNTKNRSFTPWLSANRCRGVSHTPSMAGNMFYFDAFSYYSPAINASFAHVRAYAIRPYTCSLKTKRISTKYFIENLPSHHFWAAKYPSFAAVRAYAIRPHRYSVEIKWLYPKQNIKSH